MEQRSHKESEKLERSEGWKMGIENYVVLNKYISEIGISVIFKTMIRKII